MDFEVTYMLAGYDTTMHGKQLCQKYWTKLVYKLAEQLTLMGTSTTDYTRLRNKAFELDGFFQQWDFERQSSHPNQNKGSHPQRAYVPQQASTSSTPAVRTSSGTTFGGSRQPMDIGKQSKHCKTFKYQINTFIQANAALATDEDKNWLVMSYLKEGAALEYAQLILQNVAGNIQQLSHADFMASMETTFGDPAEKARAMMKLDTMKQGN